MWFVETACFGHQAVLLYRLLDLGISVVEVEVSNNDRSMGTSKALAFSYFLSVGNSLFHTLLRRIENASIRQPCDRDDATGNRRDRVVERRH